ncbi:hypothetical protein QJS66_04420 [Kocuria rhizophila]|nr:hypothetical protein QJS66_04420 [Kocuria rhizophila]
MTAPIPHPCLDQRLGVLPAEPVRHGHPHLRSHRGVVSSDDAARAMAART